MGAHLIFLPPYSPDLNPIEQVFAKLKHLLRKAQPRDVEATWRKVGQLLDLFSQAERPNYLVNSGYGSVQVSRALGCVDTYRIHRMMAARVTTAR